MASVCAGPSWRCWGVHVPAHSILICTLQICTGHTIWRIVPRDHLQQWFCNILHVQYPKIWWVISLSFGIFLISCTHAILHYWKHLETLSAVVPCSQLCPKTHEENRKDKKSDILERELHQDWHVGGTYFKLLWIVRRLSISTPWYPQTFPFYSISEGL